MRVLSVQVGQAADHPVPDLDAPRGTTFRSAIAKRPVAGRVRLSTGGLAHDEVVDRRAHGGPDQAILAYGAAHYPLWAAEWGRDDLRYGGFGENFTVAGADEDSVCLGDRWAIGRAVLEVTKPRSPCNRLAWYQRREDLIARVRATGRSGWYLRVLAEDEVEAGVAVTLAARPCPRLTVRRAALAMAHRDRNREEAMLLVRCDALAEDWHYRLAREGYRRGESSAERGSE